MFDFVQHQFHMGSPHRFVLRLSGLFESCLRLCTQNATRYLKVTKLGTVNDSFSSILSHNVLAVILGTTVHHCRGLYLSAESRAHQGRHRMDLQGHTANLFTLSYTYTLRHMYMNYGLALCSMWILSLYTCIVAISGISSKQNKNICIGYTKASRGHIVLIKS